MPHSVCVSGASQQYLPSTPAAYTGHRVSTAVFPSPVPEFWRCRPADHLPGRLQHQRPAPADNRPLPGLVDTTQLPGQPSQADPRPPRTALCGELRLADLQTCRPANLQTCRPTDLQTDIQTRRPTDPRHADPQTCTATLLYCTSLKFRTRLKIIYDQNRTKSLPAALTFLNRKIRLHKIHCLFLDGPFMSNTGARSIQRVLSLSDRDHEQHRLLYHCSLPTPTGGSSAVR